jgi:hypothetical protein
MASQTANSRLPAISGMARERNYASFGVISAEHGYNLSRMGAQYGEI